jgi:TolA-binding protein
MALLKQVKKGGAQVAQNAKHSLARWRGNGGGGETPGKRRSQGPLWKKIILGCLVGASLIVVVSWAVFTIKPAWFASLKGRVAQNKPSPIIKKKTPALKHPTRTARTTKTRIAPTSAPSTTTMQQPKERTTTTIERPQVNIPSSSMKPQARVPAHTTEPKGAISSALPKPQVSTPSSLSPTIEDNTLEEYLEIGSLYAKKGKYDKAEDLFQKVTKENPSSAKAHNNLGFIYLKQERYELAEKEFNESLRIDPASVLPHYNMACLYSRKGMEVEALIYLKRALKRDARVKLWAMTDEDFDGLRSDVVFQELVGIPSFQSGETYKKKGVQEKESAQKQERAQKLERIQIPIKTTAPEELQAPEESPTPDETPVPEEVQPPEEAQGNTTQ